MCAPHRHNLVSVRFICVCAVHDACVPHRHHGLGVCAVHERGVCAVHTILWCLCGAHFCVCAVHTVTRISYLPNQNGMYAQNTQWYTYCAHRRSVYSKLPTVLPTLQILSISKRYLLHESSITCNTHVCFTLLAHTLTSHIYIFLTHSHFHRHFSLTFTIFPLSSVARIFLRHSRFSRALTRSPLILFNCYAYWSFQLCFLLCRYICFDDSQK